MIIPKLFLLGGYDLEMITIRELLDKHYQPYKDMVLTWNNAYLSAYQSVLESEGHHYSHIYGIELFEDITPPEQYIRIDHHNELATLPSSLEQVANILGVKLDRLQSLVAINDKGHIRGLKEVGASTSEIEEIRRKDRNAQGVSTEDEMLGKLSIEKNLVKTGSLIIVNALTDRFSAITDRLYMMGYEKLLLYSVNSLTFYSNTEDITLAINKLEHLVKTGKVYFGGNPLGFFGIKSGTMSHEEILIVKSELEQIANRETRVLRQS